MLEVEGLGEGVTVRERPPGQDPIRSLTPYRQKLLRANRFGVPYPYEIVRMLTPPAEARSAVSHRPVRRARPRRAGRPHPGVAAVRDEHRQRRGRTSAQRHGEGAGRHDPGGAVRRPDPRAGQLGRAGVQADHRGAGSGRADGCTGRMVHAVVRGQDRDGQRHREHGLDRCGAAPRRSSSPSAAAR